MELSINVNMALKKRKKKDPFRGTLVYPHRFGEERKILVIAEVSWDAVEPPIKDPPRKGENLPTKDTLLDSFPVAVVHF